MIQWTITTIWVKYFLNWTKQICKKEERITNSFESHEPVIFTKRYIITAMHELWRHNNECLGKRSNKVAPLGTAVVIVIIESTLENGKKMRRANQRDAADEMMDEASQSAEMLRLQRKLRVMENDRKAYEEDARNLLRKQE